MSPTTSAGVRDSSDVDELEGLRQAMRSYGLSPPEVFVVDDWSRCEDLEKGKANTDGTYIVHAVEGGYRARYKSWRRPDTDYQQWTSGDAVELSDAEIDAREQRAEQQQRDQDSKYAQAHLKAIDEWSAAKHCSSHPYLTGKNVPSHGLRVSGGTLLIPMQSLSGKTFSLQRIDRDGNKRFMSGGKAKGMVFVIGDLIDGKPICIAEGYATAASIHRATGWSVVTAFSANNMVTVAPDVKEKFQNSQVLLCGDNDKSGTGQKVAKKAATLISGVAAVPPALGDWNDYETKHGPDEVGRLLKSALSEAAPAPVLFDEAANQLKEAITYSFENDDPLLVLKATTGLGKSRMVRQAIGEYVKRTGCRVVFAVPNHSNTEEQAADFKKETGITPAIWRGLDREDPIRPGNKMCWEPELSLAAINSSGAVTLKAVCAACPSQDKCGYIRQKNNVYARVWFVTHASLFHQVPIRTRGEPMAAKLIIDECTLPATISQHDMPLEKLLNRATTLIPCAIGGSWEYKDHPLNQERRRVITAFAAAPDGPLHRDHISKLSGANYHKRCASWEWERKPSGGLPTGDKEGIIEAARQASAGFTILMPWLWEMLAEFQESGEEQTHRIELAHNAKGQRVVRLNRKENIRSGWRAPSLHLDATPRMGLVRGLFGDAEMLAAIDVAAPNQTVTRVTGQKFSKAWLIPSNAAQKKGNKSRQNTASKKRNKSRLNNTDKVRRFIEVQAARFSSVGVICNKGLEDIFVERGIPTNVEIGHFNNVKGLNNFESVDCLIIIGRTQPDNEVSRRLARIISGRWDCDELADDIAWTICEAELLNGALGRARGIRRTEDNPVKVFLMNDIELPVKIDGKISWKDVQPHPLEIMAARGIYLDCPPGTRGSWPVVAAVLPDIYASPDAARKDFELRSSRGETSIYTTLIDVSPREGSDLVSAKIRASGSRYSVPALVDPVRAASFVEIVKML
jgi:putative DNA primase/helicase